MAILRTLWAKYTRVLQTHPITTNCITGGGLAFLGDGICQTFFPGSPEEILTGSAPESKGVADSTSDACSSSSFDWRRALGMVTFGVYYNGAICTLVYPLYSTWLPKWCLTTAFRQGAGCAFIDEFFHMPLVYTPSFFYTTGLVQGDTVAECTANLKGGWLTAVVMTWVMWIPLQTVNFGYVPPPYRVAVLNVGCLIYNVQLDFIGDYYRKREQQAQRHTQSLQNL